MTNLPESQITRLLDAVGEGDPSAPHRLWSLVYDELHGLARGQMANEAPGRTLQTTALIHEAYLRLFGGTGVSYNNRGHFFSAAARAMRRILIDDARKRNRMKRGGRKLSAVSDQPSAAGGRRAACGDASASGEGSALQSRRSPEGRRVRTEAGFAVPRGQGGQLPLDAIAASFDEDPVKLMAVDEALSKLGEQQPRSAEVVEMRFFAGMSEKEVAEALGLSRRTVQIEWSSARAWLHRELSEGEV